MDLIKAWKAHRESIAAGKAVKKWLKRAEKIVDDDSKADDWNAYMNLAAECLLRQAKCQLEFGKAIR